MPDRKNITKSPAQNNPKPKPLNIYSCDLEMVYWMWIVQGVNIINQSARTEKTRFFIKGFSKMSSKKPTLISPS